MFCRNCGQPMNADQAVCLNCGVAKGNGKKFCPNCGREILAEEAVICVGCGVSLRTEESVNVDAEVAAKIQPRDLVKAIILTVVTCGIYGIFWFVSLTNELNMLCKENGDKSGGTCFLLSLVTCGIYSLIWAYKYGNKKDKITGRNDNSGLIYLVLSIFGVGIVAYVLLQDAVNKAVAGNK